MADEDMRAMNGLERTEDRRRRRAGRVDDESRGSVRRAEGDSRGADLRVARAADAEGDRTSCSTPSRRKTSQAALAELKQDYEPAGRAAARRGRRRLSDRHAARSARVGAPAVPRADDAEADGAGARDAGGHRLPAADHRARDHRDPRRQHVRRAQHAARAAPRSRSSAASRSSAGRSSTRRRRNS